MLILCHYLAKLTTALIPKSCGIYVLSLLTCSSLSFAGFAGDPKYPVSQIPVDLAANVDAVYRENTSVFKIISRDRASHFVRQVVTIFSSKGKFHANQFVHYDKFTKIRSLEAAVYDANGTLIKKFRDKDIKDESYSDDMLSDNRFKHLDLSQGIYPYTIEIEYEHDYKFLFYIPEFSVFDNERVSCQKASFSLQYPSELQPRVKTINIETAAQEQKTPDGLLSKNWKFENVAAITREPYGPPFAELIPTILSAPTDFEYDNYVGRMDTWDGFGKWMASLLKDRNVLSLETKEKVQRLTKDAKTREEKIRILYEYLQNRTRYVSIQLGIGGFQPFEASFVDSKGYGDCKALSNYMISLLDAVSIRANYVLIDAGEDARNLREDFPSTQFNHVIVAVPNGRDTIWLECTSQTSPFGYQGLFTGNRKALAITENGAKIVRTSQYEAEENTQVRKAVVSIKPTGDGIANITTTYTGLQYEKEGLWYIMTQPVETQKQLINGITHIPTVDLVKYDVKRGSQKNPSAVLKLDLGLRRYATVSGKRMFVVPNLMNRSTFIPEKIEQRKTNIIQDFPFVDIDSIQYNIPEDMYPEFLPEPVKITSQFGEYESSLTLDQGSVIYVRKLKIHKGVFPASAYPAFSDFYKKINRADNGKIIFLGKT